MSRNATGHISRLIHFSLPVGLSILPNVTLREPVETQNTADDVVVVVVVDLNSFPTV